VEIGLCGVSFVEEYIHWVVLVFGEVEVVQVVGSRLGSVNSAQVDDELIVYEHEHVVVSSERKIFPAFIAHSSVNCKSEAVVVAIVFIVSPAIVVDGEKAGVGVRVDVASGAQLS